MARKKSIPKVNEVKDKDGKKKYVRGDINVISVKVTVINERIKRIEGKGEKIKKRTGIGDTYLFYNNKMMLAHLGQQGIYFDFDLQEWFMPISDMKDNNINESDRHGGGSNCNVSERTLKDHDRYTKLSSGLREPSKTYNGKRIRLSP
jgi:hypothetical protein